MAQVFFRGKLDAGPYGTYVEDLAAATLKLPSYRRIPAAGPAYTVQIHSFSEVGSASASFDPQFGVHRGAAAR